MKIRSNKTTPFLSFFLLAGILCADAAQADRYDFGITSLISRKSNPKKEWKARGPAASREELPASDFGKLLTIGQALERGLSSDARVKQAYERLRKEEFLYEGKQAELFPRLKSEVFQAFATGDKHSLAYFDTSVEQPLFQGGKLIAGKRKQKVRVEAEELKVEQAKLDLQLAIRILYAELLSEKELTRISQDEVRESQESHERTRRLVENEVLARHELIRAETVLQAAKHSLVKHKENFDYILEVLSETVGLGDEESIEFEPLGEIPELPGDVNAFLTPGRREDPFYRLKELEIMEKGFEKRVLQAGLLPHVSLAARWNFFKDVFVDTDRVMLGIVGKWNIWDFGRTGSEIRAKAHEIEEAKWAGKAEIQERERQTRRIFHEARAARERIRMHEALVSQREEDYKNEKAKLVAGEKGRGDLLDSFLALEEAKRQRIEAVAQYRALFAHLERHAAFQVNQADPEVRAK
jgi:outer membrane protein TolC